LAVRPWRFGSTWATLVARRRWSHRQPFQWARPLYLPGFAAYAAMKGALEVLSRYLAKELGARGIAVNVVAPGAIETDFGGGLVRDKPEVNKFISGQTALGRVGVPDDIGGVIASLLSEENRWIPGQCIEASGGMFL
jgi:NAD(P)-dependent dehydrogenase (short-subunit alcohol dehydrogenase family)